MPPSHRNDAGAPIDFYDSTYTSFDNTIYRDIRRETWGEDIGQNSWLTAPEQDRFIEQLALAPGHRLLDVACGSGGPALRIARKTSAAVHGIDINPGAIAAATRHAASHRPNALATFEVIDAAPTLPFDDNSFDAITCIDAINHLPDRPHILAEWARILRPGGRLLFTDPIVVTGPLSSEEIAIRSSIGFFLFVAPDTNERLLTDAGLRPTTKHDLTEAMARTATAWHTARHRREPHLRRIEGDTTFEGQQRFLAVAARIAQERRLSRFAYLALKPDR